MAVDLRAHLGGPGAVETTSPRRMLTLRRVTRAVPVDVGGQRLGADPIELVGTASIDGLLELGPRPAA